MSRGPAVIRRPIFSKSNVELLNAFRANFASSQVPVDEVEAGPAPLSNPNPDYTTWTTKEEDTLYIPSFQPTVLQEERSAYDITCKLFYLPNIPPNRRCGHTKEAVSLVLKELGVDSIDLLIVSYPGVTFDADDDGDEDFSEDEDGSATSTHAQAMETMIRTWKVLEGYQEKGTIAQLGISEFSSDRLERFLPEVKIQPAVDQINVKDCCVVPKTLILYAKEKKIELLTHNDCTDILPPGTTRELLGPGGAGIIAASPSDTTDDGTLAGDIEPQWVIKYTAVVKDRGVIENKGYFAVAQVGSCVSCSSDGDCPI